MPLNVLITAVSRRVPLVKAFRHALNSLGVRGSVIATDVNPLSPGVQFCDRAYRVPLSNDPTYLDAISDLCEAEGIGLIVPTIDEELPLFASAVPRFASQGIKVAVSSEETTLICNDKYTTCTYLRAAGIAAAESFLPPTMPEQPRLPMFIKPRRGRGSIGAVSVRTRPHLDFFLGYVDDPVVQEFLGGPEYTIDLMCDFRGRPLSIVPRERVVIRSGVIDRGRTVNDRKLIDLALACADVLSFAGPINIQCRTVGGRPTVFEINPRFSGGIPLTIAAGADFPRMLLQLALGRRVEPSIGAFKSDFWMTSYESAVFLDRVSQLLPIPATADLEIAAVA
jgi:carbamoyl-phosphate synthase large subunit